LIDKTRASRGKTDRGTAGGGGESVPKIIINDTVTFVLKLQSDFGNFKPQHFPGAVSRKIASVYFT